MKGLKGSWKYRDMRLLQAIQHAVYIAFASYEVLKEQGALTKEVDDSVKRDLVHTRVTRALKRMVDEGIMYAFEFRYDATLWQGRKFELAELYIEPDPVPEYWKLRLDFAKPVNEGGVSLWIMGQGGAGSWIPVDVTRIELEVGDGTD